MNSRAKSLLGLILSLMLTIPAVAADLHVSGDTGLDEPACGTQSSPCQTIQYTLDIADTIDLSRAFQE